MLARFRTCLFFFRCSYSISEVLHSACPVLPGRQGSSPYKRYRNGRDLGLLKGLLGLAEVAGERVDALLHARDAQRVVLHLPLALAGVLRFEAAQKQVERVKSEDGEVRT